MILLEPCDLEDLDSGQALEAVTADIRAHQAAPDAAEFFTATRHTSLLAALLAALHGDALYRLDQEASADRHRAGPLTTCASQVATALAHYTRAAIPSPRSPHHRPPRWPNDSRALSSTARWQARSTPPARSSTRPPPR